MNDKIRKAKHDEIISSIKDGIGKNNIPELITSQFQSLNIYEIRVTKAMVAAEKARKTAIAIKNKPINVLSKNETLKELQISGTYIAEAVLCEAEAQKASFEFQTNLVNMTEYLFYLCIGNLANNRAVVHELELRLLNASEETISDSAKQEILKIVNQLKEQQDLLIRLEDTERSINTHHRKFDDQKITNVEITKKLIEHTNTNEKLSKLLDGHFKQLEEQERILSLHAAFIKDVEIKINVLNQRNIEINTQLERTVLRMQDREDQATEFKNDISWLKREVEGKASNSKVKLAYYLILLLFLFVMLLKIL